MFWKVRPRSVCSALFMAWSPRIQGEGQRFGLRAGFSGCYPPPHPPQACFKSPLPQTLRQVHSEAI